MGKGWFWSCIFGCKGDQIQCNGHFHSGIANSNGHGLFDICLNGDGEKEDLAWIQVVDISSKM